MTADRTSADRRAAAAALPARIAFLGFGLIGGSIARALRDVGAASRIAAWSPSGRGPAEGRRAGIVDVPASSPVQALEGAGLVVLAGPPLAVLEGLPGVADARRTGTLPADATITDVASTKARIVAGAGELGLPFVGGHPMAGRELAGVDAADGELFVGRPWVIVRTPESRAADVARVEGLARAVGAQPVEMAAGAHDRAVAAISHLPLVLAAALTESVAGAADWALARDLAATGWASATRLARGDVGMGAGILATNAPAVTARLRDLRAAIDTWLEALDVAEPDADSLRDRLAAAKAALAPSDAPRR